MDAQDFSSWDTIIEESEADILKSLVEEGKLNEEESFPTTRESAMETPPPPQSPPTPPQLKRRSKYRSRIVDDEDDSVGTVFQTLVKCLDPSLIMQITDKVTDEKREVPEIKLDYFGLLLKMVMLTVISILIYLVDLTAVKFPPIAVTKTFINLTRKDVSEGHWDDLFSVPDESIKGLDVPGLHYLFDSVNGVVYRMVKYNRVTLPIVTFLAGMLLF